MLGDDASSLSRPLVKEEVTASLERSKLRARNLAREDARILERDHDVIGAVHDERREPRLTRARSNESSGCHIALYCAEKTRGRTGCSARSRICASMNSGCARWNCGEYRTVHAILYASSGVLRTLAQERRLILRPGVDAGVSARRRRSEDEVGDARRMIDDHVLRHQATHRGAEHRGGRNLRGVEHRDHVERHRRQRRVARTLGLADASRIEGDHAVRSRQVGEDRGERRATRAEARDEQEWLTVAVTYHRQRDAVRGPRGEVFGTTRPP